MTISATFVTRDLSTTLSPFTAGDGRVWTVTFKTDSGVFSLTGVSNGSIALHTEDINSDNALYVCTGVWAVTNAGSVGPPVVFATATFTPSAADLLNTHPLGKAGLYKVYPVVTLATGPVAMDSQIIQVVSLP